MKNFGFIFECNEKKNWSVSHTQVPVALSLKDKIRIYYSTRDKYNISRISFIDVSAENPQKILYKHSKIILDVGRAGTFDEDGVMPTYALKMGKRFFLYYIGWSKRNTVPYQNSIGLAISNDGINFSKVSEGPLISWGIHDPFFTGTLGICKEGKKLRGYYLSCFDWIKNELNDKYEPLYHIKYTESIDGINWKREGKIALELAPNEGGIASAAVIRNKKGYLMLFSSRGKADYRKNSKESYKIFSAVSKNGVEFKRTEDRFPEANLIGKWNDQMQAYPYILNVNHRILVFYNGNDFGMGGIGYFVLKS